MVRAMGVDSAGLLCSGSALAAATFSAKLQSSIIPEVAGAPTPTFTAVAARTQQDWENVAHTLAANEVNFTGSRRVKNLTANSGTLTAGAGWTLDGVTSVVGATDPDSGATAYTLTAVTGNRVTYRFGATGGVVTSVGSVWIRRLTGTGTIKLVQPDASDSADISASVTSAWKRFATAPLPSDAGGAYVGIKLGTNGDSVAWWHPQAEAVPTQSNQNPGEYVSNGTLAAPFHGSGIDGVKNFATKNGNTVTANVVAEATGAPITPANGASASTTDAGGPFGYTRTVAGADTLTYAQAGNLDLTKGTLYIEGRWTSLPGGIGQVISTGAATGMRLLATCQIFDGTNAVNTLNVAPTNVLYKAASSYGVPGIKAVLDGSAVVSGAFDGSLDVGTIRIAQTIEGTVRNAQIYPDPFTNGELSEITSPGILFDTTPVDGFFNGSVYTVDGRVIVSTSTPITTYKSGLPLAATGELCTEAAAPVSFSQGVGITATGRVATG